MSITIYLLHWWEFFTFVSFDNIYLIISNIKLCNNKSLEQEGNANSANTTRNMKIKISNLSIFGNYYQFL